MLEQSDMAHYLLSLGSCQAAGRGGRGPRRSSTCRAGTACSSPPRAPARRSWSSRPDAGTGRRSRTRPPFSARWPSRRTWRAGARRRASRAGGAGSSCARRPGRDWSDHSRTLPAHPGAGLGRYAGGPASAAGGRGGARRRARPDVGSVAPGAIARAVLDLSAAAQELVRPASRPARPVHRLEGAARGTADDDVPVHGDLRWANCLALPGARLAPQDAADADRLGGRRTRREPAFDVGTVLAEYLGAWIASIPIVEPADPDDSSPAHAIPSTACGRPCTTSGPPTELAARGTRRSGA